jgi:flavin-dependent dehydrogenase
MFYGFDKKPQDNKQAYSTYIELGYAYGPASFFFGFSPWESYYTAYRNEFEVVNVGLTVSKALKITKDYSLPLRSTLVVNPSGGYNRADYVHLIFGITF